MTTRVFLAAVAATASLVACGGEEPQPTASPSDRQAENRKALLAFAQCMRENGVDMPDPKFEGGGARVFQRGPGENVDRDTMRKAEQACQKHIKNVKPPEMSAEDSEKFRKAALEHARCMRAQGIDFPDPEFDEDGGAQVRIGRGGVDPNSSKFRAAQEACRDKLPFGRGGPNTESGGER